MIASISNVKFETIEKLTSIRNIKEHILASEIIK